MIDFCLAPETLERVARQTELMDGMLRWLGIDPDTAAESDIRAEWCEARFRCVDCRSSRACARFLAMSKGARGQDVPRFCANMLFFHECSLKTTAMTHPRGDLP